jgi:prepilin peptidase CpaA
MAIKFYSQNAGGRVTLDAMSMNFDQIDSWRDLSTYAGLALLAMAACRDLMSRIIPNWVSVALAALGLANRAVLGLGAVASSMAFAAVLFLFLAWAHARGGLGGGDVKLMASAALGLSPIGTYHMLLGTAFVGGLLAVVHLMARRRPVVACCPRGASRARRLWTIEKWRWQRDGCLPYGVAIACGGAWAMLSNAGA